MPRKVYKSKANLLPEKIAGLTEPQQDAYKELRRQLIQHNLAADTPTESVVVAARQKARVEEVTRRVEVLREGKYGDGWLVETATNPARLHPLIAELRSLERAYVDVLNRLCLTTCSKKTASNNNGAAAGDNLSPDSFEMVMKGLDEQEAY